MGGPRPQPRLASDRHRGRFFLMARDFYVTFQEARLFKRSRISVNSFSWADGAGGAG
jgi:hypothetical protein